MLNINNTQHSYDTSHLSLNMNKHRKKLNGHRRIRTPKGLVRSLSKKRSGKSKSDLGLSDDGMPMGSITIRGSADDESVEASDPQPESSVLVIKELDLERDQETKKDEQKVAELDIGLKEVKSEFEEFKRTSSMERDALRKELDVMKGIGGHAQQEEAEKQPKEEPKKGGVAGMFCGIADLFDDEGYMKCCLPSDGAK